MTTTRDRNSSAIAGLPMIVRYLGVVDHGPCDDGPTAVCPHCGADGRYVYEFQCDDGTTRGAMSGCLRLFPESKLAEWDRKLREKAMKLRQSYGSDAHLNSWDTKCREALDAFYAVTGTEQEIEAAKVVALDEIARQQLACRIWREKKYGRRGW